MSSHPGTEKSIPVISSTYRGLVSSYFKSFYFEIGLFSAIGLRFSGMPVLFAGGPYLISFLPLKVCTK